MVALRSQLQKRPIRRVGGFFGVGIAEVGEVLGEGSAGVGGNLDAGEDAAVVGAVVAIVRCTRSTRGAMHE